jgi:hypothetical protein
MKLPGGRKGQNQQRVWARSEAQLANHFPKKAVAKPELELFVLLNLEVDIQCMDPNRIIKQ